MRIATHCVALLLTCSALAAQSAAFQFQDANGSTSSTQSIVAMRTGRLAGTLTLPAGYVPAAPVGNDDAEGGYEADPDTDAAVVAELDYAWAFMRDGVVVTIGVDEDAQSPLAFQPPPHERITFVNGAGSVQLPYGVDSPDGVPIGTYQLRLWVCEGAMTTNPTTGLPTAAVDVVATYDIPIGVTDPGFAVFTQMPGEVPRGGAATFWIVTSQPAEYDTFFVLTSTAPGILLETVTAMVEEGKTCSEPFEVEFFDGAVSGEVVAQRDDGVVVTSAFLVTDDGGVIISEGSTPEIPTLIPEHAKCIPARALSWGKGREICGPCGSLAPPTPGFTQGETPPECNETGQFAPYVPGKCVPNDPGQNHWCVYELATMNLKFYSTDAAKNSKCGSLTIDAELKLTLKILGVSVAVGAQFDLFKSCCNAKYEGEKPQQVLTCKRFA